LICPTTAISPCPGIVPAKTEFGRKIKSGEERIIARNFNPFPSFIPNLLSSAYFPDPSDIGESALTILI
jgi:hypothetical protein